jgi:hypothetical protein
MRREVAVSASQSISNESRSYYRPLTHAVYGIPFLVLTACFVDRAFTNDWPVVVQGGVCVFVLMIGGASTRRAFTTRIDVARAGVAVVNLMRTQHLVWDDVETVDIGKERGLWTSIRVIGKDGRKISADGLRLWGGDPSILTPDLEDLRAELAKARGSASQ